LAAQIYLEKINKEATYYFLTEVLKRTPADKPLVVLLDNAGWHKANVVSKSSFAKFLLFNVPRCWEANLIENCFSKLKDRWRRRPLRVDLRGETDLQGEVDYLAELLMEGSSEEDFSGYRRQYLRQLIGLFGKLA
jgi:transposase